MKRTPQDILRVQIRSYEAFREDLPAGSHWIAWATEKIAEFERAIEILNQHLKP